MSKDELLNASTTNGSGNAITIHISDGFKVRATHYLLIALCLALSIYAAIKAEEVNQLKTEVRLLAYWSERVNVQVQNLGIHTPSLPDERIRK